MSIWPAQMSASTCMPSDLAGQKMALNSWNWSYR